MQQEAKEAMAAFENYGKKIKIMPAPAKATP